MKYEKLVHPMEVYTGIKTYTIEQRPLTKDNFLAALGFTIASKTTCMAA